MGICLLGEPKLLPCCSLVLDVGRFWETSLATIIVL